MHVHAGVARGHAGVHARTRNLVSVSRTHHPHCVGVAGEERTGTGPDQRLSSALATQVVYQRSSGSCPSDHGQCPMRVRIPTTNGGPHANSLPQTPSPPHGERGLIGLDHRTLDWLASTELKVPGHTPEEEEEEEASLPEQSAAEQQSGVGQPDPLRAALVRGAGSAGGSSLPPVPRGAAPEVPAASCRQTLHGVLALAPSPTPLLPLLSLFCTSQSAPCTSLP